MFWPRTGLGDTSPRTKRVKKKGGTWLLHQCSLFDDYSRVATVSGQSSGRKKKAVVQE